MKEAINNVLALAKETQRLSSGKKVKLPTPLSNEDIEIISFVCELLEPLAELTDELQSDGITSSLAIIGVVNALRGMKLT